MVEARTWSFRYASARAAHSWHRFKMPLASMTGREGQVEMFGIFLTNC